MMTQHNTLYRRFGRFCMRDRDLFDGDLERLHSVMQCFLVVEAHYDMAWQSVAYQAMSTLFDEIPMGTKAPWYDIIVHEYEGTVYDVEAKRQCVNFN